MMDPGLQQRKPRMARSILYWQKARKCSENEGVSKVHRGQPEGAPESQRWNSLSNKINNDSIGLWPVEYNKYLQLHTNINN